MLPENHNFAKLKSTILEVQGEIEISSTQKIMILIIRDEGGRIKVANQKWWRADDTQMWEPGKGFHLDGQTTLKQAEMLLRAGRKILHVK